jgi:hypothetical protein
MKALRALLSLRRLLPGQGRADAPRVWLALWSHVRWDRRAAQTWVGDETLAAETGLDVRRVQRALLLLERSGLLWRKIGKPYRARKIRRVIDLLPGTKRARQPKIRIPVDAMEFLPAEIGDLRERPSATISTFYVLHAMSRAADNVAELSLSALMDMLGLRSRGTLYDQLRDLVSLGLIEKVGELWADGIRILRYVVPRRPQTLAPASVTKPVAVERAPTLWVAPDPPPGLPAPPWLSIGDEVEDAGFADPALWEAVW